MSVALIERGAFLATELASRRTRQLALAIVLVSTALFIAAIPYAKVPLARAPAFIAAYESALVTCDLITAVLLFGQYKYVRSPALLVLASGYLFTSFSALAHALSYPDLFAPTGLLGGGAQTTAWLYFFWHGGFPLYVIVYALTKGRSHPDVASNADPTRNGGSGGPIAASIAVAVVLAVGLAIVATAYHDTLPVLMAGGMFASRLTGVVTGFWLLSILSLVVLWWRRPHSVLDVWLMVVMWAWIFDIGLGALFNNGRFDFGFYAGRLYGLLAASFVLIVLLFENSMHYGRLAQMSKALTAANKTLEQLSLQDELTGLANRRRFDLYLAEQVATARRHERPLALILCDVDFFKGFNDHHGHQAGDKCLKEVATALTSCCRRTADMAARYGGEEFAIILPDTEMAGAARIAELLRHAVTQLNIAHGRSSVAPHVTISGGVAMLLRELEMSAQGLIAAADQSLYEAKQLGRNRMVPPSIDPGFSVA